MSPFGSTCIAEISNWIFKYLIMNNFTIAILINTMCQLLIKLMNSANLDKISI